MPAPGSFRDVMGLWPNLATFAREIGEEYDVVKGWWRRDAIPPKHFPGVVAKAKERAQGFQIVSFEVLHALASAKREEVVPS